MSYRFLKTSILTGLAILAGLGIASFYWGAKNLVSPSARHITSPIIEEKLNPLTIAASKARDYPGGDITIKQEVGTTLGYDRKIISYPSDGLRLNALMTTPPSPRPPDGYPVIIFNHGYIQPSKYKTLGPEYQDYVGALTLAGYRVYMPDYRGHDSSEGVAEGGNFSPVYTYDVLNLLTSIKLSRDINPSQIGMVGHSMGGGITLRSIVTSPDIKASVIVAGVVGNTEDLLYRWNRTDRPERTQFSGMRKRILTVLGDPTKQTKLWNDVSAVNFVEAIKGPVQIHHGLRDGVVPISFSERLDVNMTKAGKVHEYYAYDSTDHGMYGPYRSLFFQRMVEFLNQHVKGSA